MIESRDQSRGFPIRVVCDNMLIFDDNIDAYAHHNNIKFPNLIWDDDDEYFIAIRPSTKPEHSQLPIEISVVPYEMIQYIQFYQDAKTFNSIVDSLMIRYVSEEQQEIIRSLPGQLMTPQVIK